MNDEPKALRYAEDLASAEARVVAALPAILDMLIDRAKAGHVKVAVYLCDRIMGRTAGAKVAPADDREPPYSQDAFRLDRDGRASGRVPRIIIPGLDRRYERDRPKSTDLNTEGPESPAGSGPSGAREEV
jgi:hypothetical protein